MWILLDSFLFSTSKSSYSCTFLSRCHSSVRGCLGPTICFLIPLPHAAVTHRGAFWLTVKQNNILEASTVLPISLEFKLTLRVWVALPTFCSYLISIQNFFLSSLPCRDNYAGVIWFLSLQGSSCYFPSRLTLDQALLWHTILYSSASSPWV